jgi:uncharacterized membrane protein
LVLAGCSGAQSVRATDDAVRAARYQGNGPTALTLYTVRNAGSDNGAHSALMIDASQRVLFDPAGSFSSPSIPERDDVLFGITPQVEALYVSFHARETYYVEKQRILVPAPVAERAVQLSLAHGPVAQMYCTRAVSSVLTQLPGFEILKSRLFPDRLADDFQAIPGVVRTIIRENDADDKSIAQAAIDATLTAPQ